MTLTDKQKDIIKTINLGHERGHLLDLDELLEVLPYRTTKQSMQFSLRALIKKVWSKSTTAGRERILATSVELWG